MVSKNKVRHQLLYLAQKYVWWKQPEDTVQNQDYLMARVLTIGTMEDAFTAIAVLGTKGLKDLLHNPPSGIFNKRSYYFWYYWLGLSDVPQLPARKISN